MKKIKLILPIFAFVFAIGAAFTTLGSNKNESLAQITPFKPLTGGGCEQVTCDTNWDGASCNNFFETECSGNAADGYKLP